MPVWLIVAIVLFLLFGGGLFIHAGNLIYILLVLAVISLIVHISSGRNGGNTL